MDSEHPNHRKLLHASMERKRRETTKVLLSQLNSLMHSNDQSYIQFQPVCKNDVLQNSINYILHLKAVISHQARDYVKTKHFTKNDLHKTNTLQIELLNNAPTFSEILKSDSNKNAEFIDQNIIPESQAKVINSNERHDVMQLHNLI
jgi:hypothetical protein